MDTRSYNTPEFSEQCGFVFNKETGESIQYNYNGTGFEITINVKEIDIDSLSEGDYKILIEYKNRLSDGCTFIKKMNNGLKTAPGFLAIIVAARYASLLNSPSTKESNVKLDLSSASLKKTVSSFLTLLAPKIVLLLAISSTNLNSKRQCCSVMS